MVFKCLYFYMFELSQLDLLSGVVTTPIGTKISRKC